MSLKEKTRIKKVDFLVVGAGESEPKPETVGAGCFWLLGKKAGAGDAFKKKSGAGAARN